MAVRCASGRNPPRHARAAALAAVLFAALGVALLVAAARQPGLPPVPGPLTVVPATTGPGAGALAGGVRATHTDPRRPLPHATSRPVRLTIPRIGVRTPLVELGLNPDGTVQVPSLGGDAPAGWYRYSASPGQIGPAVILGHVDSAKDGPAVFYQLGDLRAGDAVQVTRADGRVVTFVVTRVVLVPKQRFPTDAVYGPTTDPQLRLVTCGGPFDESRHSYRDNIIAFARWVAG